MQESECVCMNVHATDVYGALDDMAVGIRLVLLMSIRQLLPAGGVGRYLVHSAGVESYLSRLPMASSMRLILHASGKRAGLLACFVADNYTITMDGSIDRSINQNS